MGTSNFHNVNANKIFAVTFPDYLDEDSGEMIEDDFGYDDLKANLISEFESLNNPKKGIVFLNKYGSDTHELRSYPSYVIGTLRQCSDFKSVSVLCEITLVIRSGYYEGVNLDWICNFEIESSTYEDCEIEPQSVEETIEYYTEIKGENLPKRALQVCNWCNKTKEELVNKIEKIYGDYSDKLNVVAQFSNGETIYEKES